MFCFYDEEVGITVWLNVKPKPMAAFSENIFVAIKMINSLNSLNQVLSNIMF